MSETLTRPDWECVPCLHCHSLIGDKCKNPNGSPYKYVHRKRINRYTQLMEGWGK